MRIENIYSTCETLKRRYRSEQSYLYLSLAYFNNCKHRKFNLIMKFSNIYVILRHLVRNIKALKGVYNDMSGIKDIRKSSRL